MSVQPHNKAREEAEKKQSEELFRITSEYKIEVIKNERTPKINDKIKNISEFIETNKDLLSSIGIFLNSSDRKNAVGLAANQISCNGDRLLYNFFVIRQNMARQSGLDIIFNPEITEKRGTPIIKYEGCLTWEDHYVKVIRKPFILVNFTDMNGTRHEGMAVTGFDAQVWQHEIDHLNGIEEELILKIENPKDEKIKAGRNDMCPCGSGQKYKKCCCSYDNYW